MDSDLLGRHIPAKPQRESFSNLLSRILHFLFNTICSLLCIIFVVGFAMWLNRAEVEVYVNNAFLTTFTLNTTTNNTFLISYDMSLNFTVTNPNLMYMDVYFDDVEASAFLHGEYLFAKVTLQPFYQGHKTTTTLEAVLQGSQTLSFGYNSEHFLQRFGAEERIRVYNIVVGLALSVRTKYGKIRVNIPYNPPYIYCDLMVPLNSVDGTSSKSLNYVFEHTKCDMGDGLYN